MKVSRRFCISVSNSIPCSLGTCKSRPVAGHRHAHASDLGILVVQLLALAGSQEQKELRLTLVGAGLEVKELHLIPGSWLICCTA